MLHSECAPNRGSRAAVVLTTKGGTRSFTAHDRLWVLGASEFETRRAVEVHVGDLVAFLGRVLAVRVLAEDQAEPNAGQTDKSIAA